MNTQIFGTVKFRKGWLRGLRHVIKPCSNDHVARYGGEEFVVFMSPVAGEDPLLRFEQLRHEVEALEVRHEDQVLRLTVSVGVASGVPLEDTSPAASLRIADEAMYEAKRTGRNRVVGHQLPVAAQQGE